MDDEQVPKRKLRVKKNKQEVTDLESEQLLDPISLTEKINIEQLFAQAIEAYKHELLIQKKQSRKEFEHLNVILTEYLSSFCIVGFTLKGERVSIFDAPTHKDEGALVDLLRSTFLDIASNRP